MNVLNTLIWTILGTSIIYRNNVVYCAEGGTDQQSSSSPGSQPASTTPPSTPTSGTTGTGTTASSDSNNKTGVPLDIKNNKDSTAEFNHNKNGNVVTYTAKGDNAFNSVKHSGNEIWSTKNKDEYATKVVLNGRGKKKKTVTIHLPNDKIKVYNREAKGKPWVEDTNPPKTKTDSDKSFDASSQPTSHPSSQSTLKDLDTKDYPSNVKLYTADASDTTKSNELETDKYKVRQDPSKTDIFVYEFNDGSKCTLVKCDDKDVWKYDSANNKDKYPKSINYNKKDSVFLVSIDDKTLKCKKENDNWKCEEINMNREGVIVNFGYDTKSTSTIDYNKSGYISTFTPKNGYGIKFVKDLNEHIWSTTDKKEFATKVEFNDGSQKSVTIHLPDGTTKKFKRNDGKWPEVTEGDQKTGDGKTGKTGTDGTKTSTDPSSGGGTNETSGGKTGTGGTGTGSPPSSGTTN